MIKVQIVNRTCLYYKRRILIHLLIKLEMWWDKILFMRIKLSDLDINLILHKNFMLSSELKDTSSKFIISKKLIECN